MVAADALMSLPEQTEAITPPAGRSRGGLVVLGLLVVLLAGHGTSLWDGVFLDDHWQRAASAHYGWGWNDLIESATIDLSGKWNHFWWQEKPIVWRYARPVAMLVVKLEYVLALGSPVGIHAFALFWHGLTGWLVYRLAAWAGLGRFWAFLAGALFILHPHSTTTVSWASARNALVNACFFAAAVLLYARASFGAAGRPGSSQWTRFVPAMVFWLLALFSRETGIIFPAIIVLLDLCFGGRRHAIRRWPVYVAVGILSAAFLYYRLFVFSVDAVPPVYFSKPSGLEYVPWALGKILTCLFSEVFYTPMVMGLSTLRNLSTEIILAYAVVVVLTGLILWWYFWASRGHCGRWFWFLWTLGAFAPVIPVFTAPHFAYLPTIPYAVMMALMLRRLPGRWRHVVTTLIILATVWSFGVYRFVYRGTVRAEQLVHADMLFEARPPPPGTRVFFINLPVANAYAGLVLREAWQAEGLEGYTLTLATHTLMMDRPSVVERTGPRELTVSIAPPGYFTGLTGGMFLKVLRPNGRLDAGTTVKSEEFDATVLEAGGDGVLKLRFTFPKRLSDTDYYFYVGSPERPAYHLRFDTAPVNLEGSRYGDLFASARSSDPVVRDMARREIHDLTRPLAIQTASPLQQRLAGAAIMSDGDLDLIEEWWEQMDAPGMIEENRRWQEQHATMLAERGHFLRIMEIVGRIVRSDLFLTGAKK